MGVDIIALFCNDCTSVAGFPKDRNGITLPEDIAEMLTPNTVIKDFGSSKKRVVGNNDHVAPYFTKRTPFFTKLAI